MEREGSLFRTNNREREREALRVQETKKLSRPGRMPLCVSRYLRRAPSFFILFIRDRKRSLSLSPLPLFFSPNKYFSLAFLMQMSLCHSRRVWLLSRRGPANGGKKCKSAEVGERDVRASAEQDFDRRRRVRKSD